MRVLSGGAVADGRPGILYFALVALPQVIDPEEPTFAGPASIHWMSAAGAVIASSDSSLEDGDDYSGLFDGYDFDLDNILSRRTVQHDAAGRVMSRTVWHSLAGDGENDGYYRTTYTYDDEGRPYETFAPNGTVSRVVYDAGGRVRESWRGIDGAPTSFVKLATYCIDGATGSGLNIGRGLLTRIVTETGEVTGASTRTVDYEYDARGGSRFHPLIFMTECANDCGVAQWPAGT